MPGEDVMANQRDPFTILRHANPVTESELEEVWTSTQLEVLDRVLSSVPSPAPSPARQRRRSRPLRGPGPWRPRPRLVVALIVIAVAGVGWTVYLSARKPSKPLTVGCYEAADLNSRTAVAVNDGRP